jgi:hypothetical protein
MDPEEEEFVRLSSYIELYLNPFTPNVNIERIRENYPDIDLDIEDNQNIVEPTYFDSSRTICLFAEYSNSNIYQAPYRVLLTTPDRRVFKYNKFKPETNTLFLEIEEPGIYTFYTAKDFKRYKVYYPSEQYENSYIDIFEENHLPQRMSMNEIDFTVHWLLTEILEGFSGTDMYSDDPY